MARYELRDDQWRKIKHLLPGKKGDPGVTAKNNRRFVDAVLWIARTGAHWRELPEEFGKCMKLHATNWNSVFQHYNRWSARGVWESLFPDRAVAPLFVPLNLQEISSMRLRLPLPSLSPHPCPP